MCRWKKKLNFILCGLLSASLLAGCGQGNILSASNDELGTRILTIGTADSGGTMYPVGKAIAELYGEQDSSLKINVSASSGSVANAKFLQYGEFDLGLVSTDVAFDAYTGNGEFSGTPYTGLRAIGAVYTSLSNWIALSSQDITMVHDLAGLKIGVGPEGSATEIASYRLLRVLGITTSDATFVNCGLGAGCEQVYTGELNAIHGFTGAPIASFWNLSKQADCRILQYTDEELELLLTSNAAYYVDIIPAGTYRGQTEDIKTIGLKCLLCVREDLDEELVYELTSLLYQNRKGLAESHSSMKAMEKDEFLLDIIIPLHDGAKRFYREQGLSFPE